MGDSILDYIIYLNHGAIYSIAEIYKNRQVPKEKKVEIWNDFVEEYKKNNESLINNVLQAFQGFIESSSKKDIAKAIKIYKTKGVNRRNQNEVVSTILAFIKFFEIYHISAPEQLDIEVVPMTYEKLLKLQH